MIWTVFPPVAIAATKSKLSKAIKLDDARRGDLATGKQKLTVATKASKIEDARHLKQRALQILGKLIYGPTLSTRPGVSRKVRPVAPRKQPGGCLEASCGKTSGQGNQRRARMGCVTGRQAGLYKYIGWQ